MSPTPDQGAPSLLVMFAIGTLTGLGAVVAIGRIGDDWGDVGAIVLVLVLIALLGLAIARQLRDEDDP
jgi:phosphate/sulfate permease